MGKVTTWLVSASGKKYNTDNELHKEIYDTVRSNSNVKKECCVNASANHVVKHKYLDNPNARSPNTYHLEATCGDLNMTTDPYQNACTAWKLDYCTKIVRPADARNPTNASCMDLIGTYCSSKLDANTYCLDFCTQDPTRCTDASKQSYCRSKPGQADQRCQCLNTKPQTAKDEVLQAMNGSNLSCWVPICRDAADAANPSTSQLTLSNWIGGLPCKADFTCTVNLTGATLSDNARIYVDNVCGGADDNTYADSTTKSPTGTSNPHKDAASTGSNAKANIPKPKDNALQTQNDNQIVITYAIVGILAVAIAILILLLRRRTASMSNKTGSLGTSN